MWRTVADWVLDPVLLGWLCAFIILRDPEVELRRRLKDQIVESLLEGRKRFCTSIMRGQLLWRVCWMRPSTQAQFAAAWRFQRLKRERGLLFARAAQGRIDIVALSSAFLESQRALRDARRAPSMPWYLVNVEVAPLTGDIEVPVLHQLIALWRDVMKLPLPTLDKLDKELDRRYPFRDDPAIVRGSYWPREQRVDMSSRRMLRHIQLSVCRKVDLEATLGERAGIEPVALIPFVGLLCLALIRYTFDTNYRITRQFWAILFILLCLISQQPTQSEKASRQQPDINHVDRLVCAIKNLAATEFGSHWFEDFVPRVCGLHNAEAECAQREAALHYAILTARLLHVELEHRSVELRQAYFAFWRQRRDDSQHRAGSSRRSS